MGYKNGTGDLATISSVASTKRAGTAMALGQMGCPKPQDQFLAIIVF